MKSGSWKRTEMQLRDEKAHAFAMAFQARPLEIGELAFRTAGGQPAFCRSKTGIRATRAGGKRAVSGNAF